MKFVKNLISATTSEHHNRRIKRDMKCVKKFHRKNNYQLCIQALVIKKEHWEFWDT